MTKMSAVKRRRIEADRKQYILDPTRQSGATKRQDEPVTHIYALTTKFMCPFCLYIADIFKFKIKNKRGYSEKRALCPDCDTIMQMRSLTAHMTVEQYAEWVYMYSASGFWDKCPYDKFRSRMKKLGWSRRFWTRYKQLKGEDDTPSYEEHIMAEQEKWAKEQGYI